MNVYKVTYRLTSYGDTQDLRVVVASASKALDGACGVIWRRTRRRPHEFTLVEKQFTVDAVSR